MTIKENITIKKKKKKSRSMAGKLGDTFIMATCFNRSQKFPRTEKSWAHGNE